MYRPKSKEWFMKRIGKRIYRDRKKRCCKDCTEVDMEGLIVRNKIHAHALAVYDTDFAAMGIYLNYRDKKKDD